ncbi:MAG: 2-isopropylmalate synthase [Acidobacteriota bacterium]
MSETNRITIFDTTLRDGEQSPGCSMTVHEKLAMARKLVDLGVDILEAGFPIASDGDFEAVQAVSAEYPGTRVAALSRAVKMDIERSAKALEKAKAPRIHTFIATSDIHLKYKFNKTREQILEEAIKAVAYAKTFVDDVEFSAEDATRTDPDYMEQVTVAVVDAGATCVNLPDTVGWSTPDEYGEMIERMVKAVKGRAIISVHCHDDLGLAVANSLAAVKAGARQIECTINGIGERAGNASLEELVVAMKVRNDRLPYTTGINTKLLYPTSQLLSSIITFGPQPNKAVVGENAFAHEAGIHQDGYLKHKSTYEIIDPSEVGVPESRLVLGKHSGRHALAQRCNDLGFRLTKEQLNTIYEQFTAMADRKKGVRNDEITQLVQDVIAAEKAGVRAS